ncbi:MAG: YkgJ family cysteine cluster protein [Candidatus Bathyarchaeia archaeon]|nr:YkgJ family cysteine cluster protein [Candidatus Bathyarchaeia archaeon]
MAERMLFVPWRYISDWKCIACGKCCKAYSVVLSFPEWLKIVKNYGVDKTVSGLDKLFIKRRSDGSCVFSYNLSNMYLCGLQRMKPKACKLWPFQILSKPKFGYVNEAVYYYGGNKFFIYADSTCSGLRYGKPTWEFTNYTLKEFVEIALGRRINQSKTTANIRFLHPYARFII